jgi:hypothetical protein
MATPPEFLMPRQVPYAPMPQGLGAYGQQAYRLAGAPPQTQQRQYSLSGPLAPFASPGGGGGSSGGDLAGLLGMLAQNPQALSGITNAAKGLLNGNSTPLVPGSTRSLLQGGASTTSLMSGIEPTLIAPSAPTIGMNPAVDAAITQASQGAGSAAGAAIPGAGVAGGGAATAAFPGSTLGLLQSGVPTSALISASAPSLGIPAGLLTPAQYATAITPTATIPGAAGAGAGASGSLAGLAGPAALIAGGLLAGQGISKGKEGQAALGGGIAGAGASLMGLGALGPLGLAGAAIAALGASMVNTKEFGDVALRNYWNAVDSGRGIGETDPNELAQGFINFYRTNKNEFPGQAKYGRTGNEDFMQDMKRTINSAIEQGTVAPNATPQEIHAKVVQPWLDTMGQGPQNAEARAIQDFMMQDLIASYQRGAPISNAEVKGDRKFSIVADPIRYPAAPTPGMATMGAPAEMIDLSGDMIPVPPGEDVLAQYMGLFGGGAR